MVFRKVRAMTQIDSAKSDPRLVSVASWINWYEGYGQPSNRLQLVSVASWIRAGTMGQWPIVRNRFRLNFITHHALPKKPLLPC